MQKLRNFFSWLTKTRARRRMVLLAGLGIAFVVIGVLMTSAWEYSNSPEFCGTTCHTMPPEYNTYLVSPHARVLCVDCHIGRGPFVQQFTRKSTHMKLLWDTITNNYEYPIRAESMRPARDTCEMCHYPEKFSDDSLRVLYRYEENEDNDPYEIYLLMHTGGGSQREGLGRGIHWHIENPIEYIALDPEEQEIPWIRVNTVDGETVEYLAVDSPFTLEDVDDYKIHEMDCITCHNRISHLLDNPRRVVDIALYQGDLPANMPYIRAQSVTLLQEEYESFDKAKAAFATLKTYYEENYPDYFVENEDQIDAAIALLEQLYEENNYPDQELSWQTHPNNIGHRDAPGCFRCHDGEHFSVEEDGGEPEAVRLECNLCHSVPQVVWPGEIEPMLPLTTGIEPASHLDSTWISRHHVSLDATCANCHTTDNPGGTTDTSFCANSACHGTDWVYAKFDASALATELGIQRTEPEPPLLEDVPAGEAVTYQTLFPLFELECSQCHGPSRTKGLQVTAYDTLMAGGEDGPVIVKGAPDESLIVAVLEKGHFGQFTEEQLALLRQWIADGAPQGEPVVPEEAVPPAEAEGPVTYDTLQPVFESECGTCHGPSRTKGLQVTEYDTLMAGGEDGPVIVKGAPDESLIIAMLEGGHYGQFTEEQLALLRQWIADGAPPGGASAPETGGEADTGGGASTFWGPVETGDDDTQEDESGESEDSEDEDDGGFSWGD